MLLLLHFSPLSWPQDREELEEGEKGMNSWRGRDVLLDLVTNPKYVLALPFKSDYEEIKTVDMGEGAV